MKRILYILLMGLVATIGCKRQLSISGDDLHSIAIDPTFASTKSSSASFDAGDQVGVFVVKNGQQLRSGFNASDNILFKYFTQGDSLGAVPVPLFYPDKITPVAIYAYYPYQMGVRDALCVRFAVTGDTKASDLCYATRGFASPTDAPMSLTFRHVLAKTVVGINHQDNLSIEKVTSVRWLAVRDSCSIDLADGAVEVSDHRADIECNDIFEAILPPQKIVQGRLLKIETLLKNGSMQVFYYTPLALDVELMAGHVHTFNLTIRDDNSVALVDGIAITAWEQGSTAATMGEPADNSFTLHWMLPNLGYQNTKSVVLNVRDSRNGYLSPYTTSGLVLQGGHSELAVTLTFSLASTTSRPLSYPYTIETIDFIDLDGELIRTCKSLIAATLYRTGAITLGVEQDNLLMITTGTLSDWVPQNSNGEIGGGGVANSFQIKLLEQSYFALVKSLRMTIDGAIYEFSGVTASGNGLISSLTPFLLPDKNGSSPQKYPYTIEKVELLGDSGNVLHASARSIKVARGGLISFQIYN